MKDIPFSSAHFLCSILTQELFPEWKDTGGRTMPEIALVGRSNVGKSSLINHLLTRKKLAKVSSTPGKTQTINFFSVDNALILVDLPGYGYAKSPQVMQKLWAQHIDRYLCTRTSLTTLLILLDVRREPNEKDLDLVAWAIHNQKKLLFVFTKCDTVKAHEKQKSIADNLNILRQMIQHEEISYVEYSIRDPQSKKRLILDINKSINIV